MLTLADIINSKKSRQRKPDEDEIRRLPYKYAFIYGRLSSPGQVKDHHESMRAIALLVDLAIKDGYDTKITAAAVEKWLNDIQKGKAEPGVWSDGQVTVELRDLGLSGRLDDDHRPGLAHLKQTVRDDKTGTVYLTEGVSRLSRDEDGIIPLTLLKLFREHSCRIRTRRRILNPCIQRDREVLEEDFRDARKEGHTMDIRMHEGRRDKAAEGKYVGGPIIPGFIVEIMETKPSGRRVYGKLQAYPPHAEIVVKILREYIKQGFSKKKTHRALDGLQYPLFPPELEYMEHLSSLRKVDRTESGYIISPAMIRLLALNVKLIGAWTWGDTEPRYDNHDAIVPVDLFLEAYEGAIRSGKPRGPSIRHEPLVWNHLLYCCNHDLPIRMSGHTAKEAYRCQHDYIQGRGPACFDIAAHYLEEPLTTTVLQQLDFTPFAEEVLMQLEADVSHSSLEVEQRKKEITALERRLENLKPYLGCGNKEREEFYWQLIEKTKYRLNDLRSRPVQSKIVPTAHYYLVREFLAGLPQEWGTYSRTARNQLLRSLIDRVDIRHGRQVVEATIHWKTGQSQVINIRRARAKGNPESRWIEQEKDLLKMLWPDASQDMIIAAFPGRTWKAIAHQAYNQGWRRIPNSCNQTPRRRWESDEEHKAKQLYETGTPTPDIASKLGRSCSAVLQRAWEKRWPRPNANQKPTVPNRVSSGLVFGGQVRYARGRES